MAGDYTPILWGRLRATEAGVLGLLCENTLPYFSFVFPYIPLKKNTEPVSLVEFFNIMAYTVWVI